MTEREEFEKWCDATGRYEDEHYYMQGSQVRRHYPDELYEAWFSATARFILIGYRPNGGDQIVDKESADQLNASGIGAHNVYGKLL